MDWLRNLLLESSRQPERQITREPQEISFQSLKGEMLPPEILFECILITSSGENTPINAAAMGVKLSKSGYLIIQPFTNTDTYANLTKFGFATVNFTSNPLIFARCALQGWGAGPGAQELCEEDLYRWKDFPIPSLKSACLSLKCTREIIEEVVVGSRAMILLGVKTASIFTPYLPLVNRADNLALESIVHATRVKIFIEKGDFQGAKELFALIDKYERFINSNAPEKSSASETIKRVKSFLAPFELKIR